MTDFSPITQAVWNAAYNTPEDCPYEHDLAAALEAAADQVISPFPPPCEDFDEYAHGFLAAHIKYRAKLLAIAAELRGQGTPMTEQHPITPMTEQITLEQALELVDFDQDSDGTWRVHTVKGSCGTVEGDCYAVEGNCDNEYI